MEYNYKDLGLKMNTETVTFNFNDREIEIFKYLPLEYKYDVIMCSLHDSEENGIYNYVKLDAYFNLNLFIAFVKNITFSKEDLEDKLKLYNEIYSSGLMAAFLKAVDEKEYNDCYGFLKDIEESIMKYKNTAGAALSTLVNTLPQRVKETTEIIQNIDLEKLGKFSIFSDKIKELTETIEK